MLKQLFAGTIEEMLEAEMAEHLGYAKNSVEGNNSGNSRNGYGRKTIKSEWGESEISIPRDRNGEFEPRVIGKRQTRTDEIERRILAMYGKGMSVRDIEDQLRDIYGTEVSASLISNITDKIGYSHVIRPPIRMTFGHHSHDIRPPIRMAFGQGRHLKILLYNSIIAMYGGEKMRCEETVKIQEVLRLWEEGYSQRKIAESVKCAKSTVGEIQRRSREQGFGYEEAARMTNAQIQERLYPKVNAGMVKAEPEWAEIHKRLESNRRLNLQYVWEEYRVKKPEGLGYSQFCRRYHLWREKTGKEVIMVQTREPGRELFVDWMGDTLKCVADGKTGEVQAAHFFVAALGDSNYPYVEAFADEGHENWLTAHIHALEWLGGVPRVIVPDNCKTAVTKSSYYDPKVNPAYWELAKHYSVAVIPARVRKPRDKATVEGSVGWLETWLLEWLRGQRFFNFEELNRAIRGRVLELVKRPFQKRAGSRAEVFEAVDKPALRPLPATRYEHVEYIERRVPDNYHVEYDGRYYSVPYTLFREKVTIRAGMRMIEILNGNRERVALHQRARDGSRYVTLTTHMPKKHQYQQEINSRDGESYRAWAQTFGPATWAVVDGMLRVQVVEESAYRSCMGVLQLGKKYGAAQIESACKQAQKQGKLTYTAVKDFLENPSPQAATPTLPSHENLRDPAEFV
jgi:transposase